jgi:DNA ligase (NAD+)
MMSLDNAFSDEDVSKISWAGAALPQPAEDDAAVAMTAEDKIDGLSCSLRYEHGGWSARRRAATGRWARM